MIMYGESPSLSEKKEYDVIVDLQPITNHPQITCSLYLQYCYEMFCLD